MLVSQIRTQFQFRNLLSIVWGLTRGNSVEKKLYKSYRAAIVYRVDEKIYQIYMPVSEIDEAIK